MGATLREILEAYAARRELIPSQVVLLLARDLLAELANLHQTGRLFGPVPPDYMRLWPEGRFCLTTPEATFSSAGATDQAERESLYLAPEAVIHGVWNAASDVFSAGVVLWECLFGQHPFRYGENEQLQETLAHITYDAPLVPPGLGGRNDDRGVLALASVMLIKDIQGRPTSWELLAAIHIDGTASGTGPLLRIPLPVAEGERHSPSACAGSAADFVRPPAGEPTDASG